MSLHRLTLLLAALIAVVAVGSCSSSDDQEQGGPNAGQTSGQPSEAEQAAAVEQRAAGARLTGDRAQAEAAAKTIGEVYEGMAAAVESGVARSDRPLRDTVAAAQRNRAVERLCGLLSEDARRKTIAFARTNAGLPGITWRCESATGLLLRRARQLGGLDQTLDAKVVRSSARGDRATATVDFGGEDSKPSTIRLVKEGGEWKLAAAPGG